MHSHTTPSTIAFIGTGLMGRPMASRLLAAGHRLYVWNRTRAKAEVLGDVGAIVVDRPEQAIEWADIVITMLEDGSVVAALLRQAASSARPGTLFIDMSSTSQAEALELGNMLTERELRFLDAPVSGGVVGAEAGSLAVMVGGAEEDFERARPVLSELGRPTRVGPVGSGQLAKLCNQLIVGGTLGIIAEALLLAQAGGADPVAVRAAIRGGFAESRLLEVHGERMIARNFLPGGQVKSQAKDMRNVMLAASTADLRLPITELVTTIYQELQGFVPNADQSASLLALERMNPGIRLGTGDDKLP